MNRTFVKSKSFQRRSGTILLCVLVCLALVITFVMTTTKTALRARRQTALQFQRAQAELLLEAGIQRAVRLVATDPQFDGETWKPTIESLPPGVVGAVEIQVAHRDGTDPLVSITARVSKNSLPLVQLSYQFRANNF